MVAKKLNPYSVVNPAKETPPKTDDVFNPIVAPTGPTVVAEAATNKPSIVPPIITAQTSAKQNPTNVVAQKKINPYSLINNARPLPEPIQIADDDDDTLNAIAAPPTLESLKQAPKPLLRPIPMQNLLKPSLNQPPTSMAAVQTSALQPNPMANPQQKIIPLKSMRPAPPPPPIVAGSTEHNTLLDRDANALVGGQLKVVGTLITSQDCQNSAFFRKYRQSDLWHRVVVNHRGAHSKQEILANLHKMLSTADIYPCYYVEYPQLDTFCVYNTFEALQQLVADCRLLIRIDHNVHCPLELHMNFAPFKKTVHVDPLEQIRTVIGQCFSPMDRKLDLSDFGSFTEFQHIELGLHHPATMSHVLITAARRYFGEVETICLANNALETTLGMRPLTWMTRLNTLDLSNNKVSAWFCCCIYDGYQH